MTRALRQGGVLAAAALLAGCLVTSPSPTTTSPSQTVTPSDPVVDTVWPSQPPFPGFPSLGGVEPALQGGCGAVYRGTELVAADQCGPVFLHDALRLRPISATPREILHITAPAGYAFSVADVGFREGWSVTIAPAAAVASLDPETIAIIPASVGTVVASRRGPDRTVTVGVPERPGAYVLQLAAPVARDGWTFAGSVYFWLIRVATG